MKHGVYVAYRVVGCREDNQEVNNFISLCYLLYRGIIFSDSGCTDDRPRSNANSNDNRNYTT